MESIIYLVKRTIVNSIKELRKKPLRLILYIGMVLLIIVSLRFAVKGNVQPSDKNVEVYKSIFLGLIIMFLFVSLKTGIEKGNTLFRLSDANFLFPAPIKPQLILFYGFTKQMGNSFLLIIVLAFQMPNLYYNFPMKDYGWAIILVVTFLFAILTSIIGVLLYSIGSIKKGYKKTMNRALYGFIGFVFIGMIYNVIQSGEPLQGFINFFNMRVFDYLPIIGWILNIYTSAILGFSFTTIIYISLIMLSGIGFLFVIYSLNLDYYEDALNNSITKEEQLTKAKKGKLSWNQSVGKTRKTTGKIRYTKGRAILSKQMLETNKTGSIFTDKATLFILGFGLIFAYIMRENSIDSLLYMMIYMNIVFSQSNLWAMELEKHYIYLIPESSTKKVVYATLLENMKALGTGLIAFSIATFIFDVSVYEGLVLGVAYGSFTSVILFSDLLIRKILGVGLSLFAERFIKFFMIGIILVPGIILSFLLGLPINPYTAGQGAYLVLILYNILVSSLFIVLSRGIFEKIDMR